MNRLVIIVIVSLIIGIIILALISFLRGASKDGGILPILKFDSSPTPASNFSTQIQKVFKVVETSPQNNAANVSNEEIPITFTTDVEIISEKGFSLEINPPLPHYYKFTNSYPTKTVTAQVFGGLQPNSTYTLVIKNQQGSVVYSWSFTTSPTPPQSTSGYVAEYEKRQAEQYYPLLDYVPYFSSSFDLGYSDKLTLRVAIKNPDINEVKQEVEDWIRSKGVDPATHTINYINSF